MIDYTDTCTEIKGNLGLKCPSGMDAAMLIRAAEYALCNSVSPISAESACVHMLWSWLEGTKIEILAVLPAKRKNKSESVDDFGARLSENISAAFKSGAVGVQLSVPVSDLEFAVSALLPVKDDLFFGRKLFIGLDFFDIECFDWEDIYYQLNKIGALGILLYKSGGKEKKKDLDDTSGRLYGFFDVVPMDFKGAVQLAGFDIGGTESAWRLCQKMRPDLLPRITFFIDSKI